MFTFSLVRLNQANLLFENVISSHFSITIRVALELFKSYCSVFFFHKVAGKGLDVLCVSFILVWTEAQPITVQLKCIKMLISSVIITLFPDCGTCSFHPGP